MTEFRPLGRRHWATADGRYQIRNVAHGEYVATALSRGRVDNLGRFATLEAAQQACQGHTDRQTVILGPTDRRILDSAELERELPGVLALAHAVRRRFGEQVKLRGEYNEPERT